MRLFMISLYKDRNIVSDSPKVNVNWSHVIYISYSNIVVYVFYVIGVLLH